VWELKNKGFLDRDKPIIIVGRFWKPLMELIAGADSECVSCIEIAEDVSGVMEILSGLKR
jgi:hypothetical protein